MNLVETHGEDFVFQMGQREKERLCGVLQLYPLLNSAYHRLSKTGNPNETQSAQKLLESAMEDQRRENKEQLMTLLNDAQRFQPNRAGFRLCLTVAQMEWLLQVLNDVRVGSWLILGCPDENKGKPAAFAPETARYFGAMELCAIFQMALLDAFESR